jgi:hypothetical protein
MNTQRLAAVLLIAACVATLLSTMINAPGLYATQDIEERLQIIEMYRTRWLTNQALVVLFGILLVAGFGMLASLLRTKGQTWIPVLGAVAMFAGTISGLYFLYLQTADPRGGYSGAYPIPEQIAYWLWLGGMLLFGFAFLQASLPAWLGYVTVGTAIVYGLIFLLTGAGSMTPFLLAFLELAIGIALLRASFVL